MEEKEEEEEKEEGEGGVSCNAKPPILRTVKDADADADDDAVCLCHGVYYLQIGLRYLHILLSPYHFYLCVHTVISSSLCIWF